MSNTRRANGVPAAFSATGQHVPESPDVAEANLANVIGQAVAMHLAQLLAQQQAQSACVLCVQNRKQAEQAYQVAVDNAAAAAEPQPPLPPEPPVMPAVTWVPLGQPGQPGNVLPVCYAHFPSGPQVRSTGLVDASGNAILARG